MNSEKLTFQVKFWALIGPFISLLTLFVFFVKGSATPIALPLVLLFGVPICWKWKLKGFAGSVIVICSILFYYYLDIPLEERFWHLGMGISITMSLLITALSFEEVESLIEAMKVESRSRLENLWKVDEKLQQTTGELKKKKDKIREMNVKTRSYQRLLDKSTEELVELRANHQKTTHELYQTNKELEELQQRLIQVQDASHPDAAYKQLREQFNEKQQFLEEIRKELFRSQEQLLNIQRENEELKTYQLSEVEEALERHLVKMEREIEEHDTEHQKEIDTLQEMLAQLLKSQK
jgi:hypothetical protein